MLPKKRRMSRPEVENLVKFGERHNSPHLLLYISKNSLDHSRFSFSVSKKVAKTAVARNKWRRRGYSVIAKSKKNINGGYFCLFVFKKGSNEINYDFLEKEISQLLYKTDVLR